MIENVSKTCRPNVSLLVSSLIFLSLLASGIAQAIEHEPLAGEIFGKAIPKKMFDFSYKTMTMFSVSPKEAENDRERRTETWKHLIFLHEAEHQQIKISKIELEKELTRLFAEKNVAYGSTQYLTFIEQNFSEAPADFEQRIENLLKVKKLIDGIMNPPPPTITDEDAQQKFLNQYNSMATEFLNFPTLEEAEKFYQNTSAKEWDKEKTKNQKFSTPTGHISLEAVIDLWQVPTKDAYRIHAMKIDEIAAPAKMYKGYGVFRLKEKRKADIKEYTEQKKEEYKKILAQVYYYNHTHKILKDIVTNSNFRDYERDKVMVFETLQGAWEVLLWTEVAPKACENFIKLTEKGYYNGTIFHRVISGFMIQGGDPTGTGAGGQSFSGQDFEDETNKDVQFDRRGLLAMANQGPGTNRSQFFITLAPKPQLNMKHTIFGEIIKGYEVVQKIGQAPTDSQDRPITEQKIIRVYLKKWEPIND